MANKLNILFQNILPILLGTAIYAFGLHYFVIPNELMEGGVTGVALLLNYALDLPPSITTLVLNIPLFIIGWKLLGKQFMALSMLGTISLSVFLWLMEICIARGWIVPLNAEQDYLLAVLYAGLTLGAGLGIVFRYGGTTGGSDIVARIGNKLKGWSMGQVILVIDVIVIGSSLLYIPQAKVLYTLVLVFIASRIIDFIQEGRYAAKAFTIISERTEEISDAIQHEHERGVTFLKARGGYTKENKEIVYCVVSKQESRRLQLLVKQADPRAFMIISDVHDVLGEGFRLEAEHTDAAPITSNRQ